MLNSWKKLIADDICTVISRVQNNDFPDLEKKISFDDIKNSIIKPRNNNNGDLSSNIAFKLSKLLSSKPIDIAELIKSNLDKNLYLNLEIAQPGFINFWLLRETKFKVLSNVISNENFGFENLKTKDKIILEFVSANPTGPLHVGHARQAVLGDSISRILKAAGADITKEFYYNDGGNQIKNLTLSVVARANKIDPSSSNFPTDGYKGDYIQDIADEYGEVNIYDDTENVNFEKIQKFSIDYLRNEQKTDLLALDVAFDSYALESSFYHEGKIDALLQKLNTNKKTYIQDSALWFKAKEFGDDKDRVMKKTDGTFTYFVPDVAYHYDKWLRGFDRAINIQGFDHHGTIKRVSAGLQALDVGIKEGFPETILHKMVKVVKDGKEVKISKRSGSFVTLRDLICWSSNFSKTKNFEKYVTQNEFKRELIKGRDIVRFFLLSKKAETEFTFDVNLGQKQSEENPVFYVQYAHARACNVIEQSGTNENKLIREFKALSIDQITEISELLNTEKESLIMIRLSDFPSICESAVSDLAPHVIVFYLLDLAKEFHSYYNDTKINVDNLLQRNARLFLVISLIIIFRKCLNYLGISQPRKM